MTAEQAEYELVIGGRIGSRVKRALPGFEITSSESDQTQLRGWRPDQAARHGSFERIRDLALELHEVPRVW